MTGAADDQRHGLAGTAILGMARSGTSAVAGLFREAGFYMGARHELMGPDDYNPRGYNEHLRLYAENERILQRAGGSWFSPPRPDLLIGGDAEPRLRELVGELRNEAAGAPIVIKDPRVGVLTSVWRPIIDELLHPVLVIRDPIEVAMSLAHRDGTPAPVGLAGWEVHMTELLAALTDRLVTVVHYETVLANPIAARAAVQEVLPFIEPELLERVDPARAAAGLDPTLRRNRAGTGHAVALTGFQRRLWEFLKSLPPGPTRLQPPAKLLEATSMAQDAVRVESRRIALVEEMREIRQQHDELAAEIERGRVALADCQTALADSESAARSVRAELERAHSTQNELNQRIASLAEENEVLQGDRAAAAQEIQRLTALLEALTQSTSWRMTQPLREVGRRLREREH